MTSSSEVLPQPGASTRLLGAAIQGLYLGSDLQAAAAERAEPRNGHPTARFAAVSDLHISRGVGRIRRAFARAADEADALLLAGDLTDHGEEAQARQLADVLSQLSMPVIAVLGNHDHLRDKGERVRDVLLDAGVYVLEGTGTVLPVGEWSVGIAGLMGFGGGFGGDVTDYEAQRWAQALDSLVDFEVALSQMDCDARIALMHYAPISGTLVGEPRHLYPALGSHLLGDACDRAGATVVVHGHAHHGSPHGTTGGGIPVYNVAWRLARPYRLITVALS